MATAIEVAREINEGEAAPFDGVLLPQWEWKKVNEDLIQKDFYQKQVLDNTDKPGEMKTFLMGFLAGSVAVIVAEKLGGSH